LRHQLVSLAMVLCTLVVCAASPSPAAAQRGKASAGVAYPARLPGNLVFLRDIDPSIQQDIRYATARNFTGAPLPGYIAAECILTRPTADALARVQSDLKDSSASLKVYDCYRPRRASRAMSQWLRGGSDTNPSYNPHVRRNSLRQQGYVAETSTHARGDTIDLTLVQIEGGAAAPVVGDGRGPCNGPVQGRESDNSVDMGTSFDCFDPKSFTRSSQLTNEQRRWRTLLLRAMERHGFRNYFREWWHYTHDSGAGASYDFAIEPRKTGCRAAAPENNATPC